MDIVVPPSIDHNTVASDPGSVDLSYAKLRQLEPETFGFTGTRRLTRRLTAAQLGWVGYLSEHLGGGDSRAAVVMSVRPLQVSAFSSELDWAVVLGYPDWLVDRYGLVRGQRLLTVNTYARGGEPPADVRLGPAYLGRWINVYPLIAEFLTDNLVRPATRRMTIDDEEWLLADRYGREYLQLTGGRVRDGRPTRASEPAPMPSES